MDVQVRTKTTSSSLTGSSSTKIVDTVRRITSVASMVHIRFRVRVGFVRLIYPTV